MIIVDMPWIMNGKNELFKLTWIYNSRDDLSESDFLIVNTRLFSAAWKIVKSWLGPEAISKLKFASKTEIQSFIGLEYLPSHMGGTVCFSVLFLCFRSRTFCTDL